MASRSSSPEPPKTSRGPRPKSGQDRPAEKLSGGLQEAVLAPSGLDFGTFGSCPPPLYLQHSGNCFAIFGGRCLNLAGARFSRPLPLPLQPSGEHIRLLLARYSKPHSLSPPYRASRAKRGMEHIHESQRAKHEHVILFGLHPLCAKRIIPGMSPSLYSSAK